MSNAVAIRSSLVALVLTLGWLPVAAQGASGGEVVIGGNKIVGGAPTTIEEHPWQAALIVKVGGSRFLCGGSVVGKHWILTAAHCFGSDPSIAKVKVVLGETKFLAAYQGGLAVDAITVIVHPHYDRKTHLHDVALVKISDLGRAAVIPLAVEKTKISVGENLVVTGWGATIEGGSASDSLLMAAVPYVENETCNQAESYNGEIADSMMCAGDSAGGEDSCQGDSGGPLVKGSSPGEAILVGVVSFGEGCARKLKYGVYTRVSKEIDWINSVIH